ncbi:MAG: hypothetical protein ACTJHU_10425, partial [Mycetocola sp.]
KTVVTRYPDDEWGDGYLNAWADRVARVLALVLIWVGRIAIAATIGVVLIYLVTRGSWMGQESVNGYTAKDSIAELTQVTVFLFWMLAPLLLLPLSPEVLMSRDGDVIVGITVLGRRRVDLSRARRYPAVIFPYLFIPTTNPTFWLHLDRGRGALMTHNDDGVDAVPQPDHDVDDDDIGFWKTMLRGAGARAIGIALMSFHLVLTIVPWSLTLAILGLWPF